MVTRKAITSITLLAVLAAAALFSGCGIAGSGKVITEEKDFTGFTDVEVGSFFEVDITRSDSYSVILSVDKSLLDYIDVSQAGGTLKISLQPRHVFTDFTLKTKPLKAKITMPVLFGLQLSGASHGTVSGFESSSTLSLRTSGANSLKIVDIKVGDANFNISGASKVSGNMTAVNANLGVLGASTIELSGSAKTMILQVGGASKVHLPDFFLQEADVDLSGASEATVNVKGRLDIVVSGASTFYFLSNPTIGNISVSGASTVKHKE
ncbi:MAG: DUF2807 domain-containing protein [Chloroflexi bacterium]|nr:DUF2807 domain-containing protein [Chloroflexota bacterium]